MRRLDGLYLECPFFGSRRMAVTLGVNRKRTQRLMGIMGIEALYPKCNLSRPAPGHEIYPYLLRKESIERAQPCLEYRYYVCSDDYLVAVMYWFSRFVLSCPRLASKFGLRLDSSGHSWEGLETLSL